MLRLSQLRIGATCAAIMLAAVGCGPIPVAPPRTLDLSGFKAFTFAAGQLVAPDTPNIATVTVDDSGEYLFASAAGTEDLSGPRKLTDDEVATLKAAIAQVSVQDYFIPMFPFCGDVIAEGIFVDDQTIGTQPFCVAPTAFSDGIDGQFQAITAAIRELYRVR